MFSVSVMFGSGKDWFVIHHPKDFSKKQKEGKVTNCDCDCVLCTMHLISFFSLYIHVPVNFLVRIACNAPHVHVHKSISYTCTYVTSWADVKAAYKCVFMRTRTNCACYFNCHRLSYKNVNYC